MENSIYNHPERELISQVELVHKSIKGVWSYLQTRGLKKKHPLIGTISSYDLPESVALYLHIFPAYNIFLNAEKFIHIPFPEDYWDTFANEFSDLTEEEGLWDKFVIPETKIEIQLFIKSIYWPDMKKTNNNEKKIKKLLDEKNELIYRIEKGKYKAPEHLVISWKKRIDEIQLEISSLGYKYDV